MQDEEAPPVVAVVVAHDPGPWFEECLGALGSQDYPSFSVLVVDAASAEPVAPRVASVLPGAYIRRLEENPGFGAAANDALGAVEGATHLIVSHDDVAPDPDAVRKMIEQAFRSNAGVVAPKLVSWNEPDRLLQVGMGVDRYGAPVPRIDPGEIDQSQQDEVREVFAAPGGFTLFRADLLRDLGGFDDQITLFGEDVDISWRAQIAGARVVVEPAARVRHLQATAGGLRSQPDKRFLQRRHELRAVLKNSGPVRRVLGMPRLALMATLEALYCLVTGNVAQAREVVDSWRWNLSRQRGLRQARRQVAATRHVPDRALWQLQTRSSVRLRRFARHRVAERRAGPSEEISDLFGMSAEVDERGSGEESAELDLGRHLRIRPGKQSGEGERRLRVLGFEAIALGVVVAVVLLFGVRDLVDSRLPLIGSLAPLPSPTTLLGDFFGGWGGSGTSRIGPVTPAFGMLGALGILLVGAMGVVEKLLLLGSVALGVFGASRLLRPFGSPRARLAAAIVYAATPLPWNDVSRGDLQALAAFALMPFILLRLGRASGLAPFDTPASGSIASEVLALGLLLFAAFSFVPGLLLVTIACIAAICLGSLVAGEARSARRLATVGLGGSIAALVGLGPWALGFVGGGAGLSAWLGPLGDPSRAISLGTLMRFEIGPMGAGVTALAFLAAAVYPLLV
ncbi:MAG TPA: glycosyltransferase family 2 protein, partial [Acidimicrobiales bacterium]|nr:glycosyltransferase family 2 protein [Acidimicrobiales bacterium]